MSLKNMMLTNLSNLSRKDIEMALAIFVNRFTGDFRPEWAGSPCPAGGDWPLQFETDAEWVAHTEVAVTSKDKIDMRYRVCRERPTWPNNPELRGQHPAIMAYYAPNLRYDGWSRERNHLLAFPQPVDDGLTADERRIFEEMEREQAERDAAAAKNI